jgi:prephenate dehydrogenase
MSVQISVLGLGQVGLSIGLALASHKDQISRLGSDSDPKAERAAIKLGAFDQIKHSLPAAVENAELVVLACPVDEIRPTLEIIAPVLKPGAVVIDTSPVKVKVMEWVQELFPAERYFISMFPTLNPECLDLAGSGPESARADLFKNSLMVITNPPDTPSDALQLASDLAVLLGGTPYYADAWEVDGLLAALHLLPRLVAAALTNAVTDQPGWREGRKLASQTFAAATRSVEELDEVKSFGQAALFNRENTLRVLANLVAELETLQVALADQDAGALAKKLVHARQNHQEWWAQRKLANWNAPQRAEPLPTSGEVLGRLIGLGKRKKS